MNFFPYAGVHPRSSQFITFPSAAHVTQPIVARQEFLRLSQKQEACQSADGTAVIIRRSRVVGHRSQVAQFAGKTKNISPIYNLSVVINRLFFSFV